MKVEEATQIMHRVKKGDPMPIPSVVEARDLMNRVKGGDIFAMEQVTLLWHNMAVSTARDADNGLAVRIIFEAYLKYVQKEFNGVTEEF